MANRLENLGHSALLLSVSVYSVGLILQKQLALEVHAATIATVQFGAASLLLWGISLYLSPNLQLSRNEIVLGLVWGIVAPGISLILNMYGSTMTDGVTMMLIWALLPVFASILSPLVIREKTSLPVAISSLAAILGVWLGVGDRVHQGWSTLIGASIIVAAVFLAALGYTIGRKLNRRGAIWHRIAALQVTGAAVASVFAVFLTKEPLLPEALSTIDAMSFLYLIIFMSVLNFVMFNFALMSISASWAALYTVLNAPFGAFAAFTLLGDPLRLRDGVMLLIVGLAVAAPHAIAMASRPVR